MLSKSFCEKKTILFVFSWFLGNGGGDSVGSHSYRDRATLNAHCWLPDAPSPVSSKLCRAPFRSGLPAPPVGHFLGSFLLADVDHGLAFPCCDMGPSSGAPCAGPTV